MSSFTDSKNRTWAIDVNMAAIRRVKRAPAVQEPHGPVNLADLKAAADGGPPLLTRLSADVELLVDVVHAIVEPQLQEAGVDPEAFAEALGGDAICGAHDALFESLSDFFRQLQQPGMVAALTRQREFVRAQTELEAQKINDLPLETLTQRAAAKIDQQMAALDLGTTSASSSPPSAASSPGNTQPAS